MAEISNTVTLLRLLRSAYPEKTLTRETTKVYIEALRDVPATLLHQAVLEHINESNWFPKVAELRQRALAIEGVRSFDALPERRVDWLRMEEISLTKMDTIMGGFDTEAWRRLVERFEEAGRYYAAESIRRRIEFFSGEGDPTLTNPTLQPSPNRRFGEGGKTQETQRPLRFHSGQGGVSTRRGGGEVFSGRG